MIIEHTAIYFITSLNCFQESSVDKVCSCNDIISTINNSGGWILYIKCPAVFSAYGRQKKAKNADDGLYQNASHL